MVVSGFFLSLSLSLSFFASASLSFSFFASTSLSLFASISLSFLPERLSLFCSLSFLRERDLSLSFSPPFSPLLRETVVKGAVHFGHLEFGGGSQLNQLLQCVGSHQAETHESGGKKKKERKKKI